MNLKKELGQFYTTNYKYILQNLYIPSCFNGIIIEPFCGKGNLIPFINDCIEKNGNIDKIQIECYDIESNESWIIKRDTLNNPPNYLNKFVITNPPYLARNKTNDKIIFDKYKENDLYKCFLRELISNCCYGGILIVPLNFFSSIRSSDIKLRNDFFNIYKIIIINIFEEKVFNDTSYTVVSFLFIKKSNLCEIDNSDIDELTKIIIHPSLKEIKHNFSKNNNYMIGGDIYNLKLNNSYSITRISSKNKDSCYNTNINVKCIDDNENNKIKLIFVNDVKDIYIDTTPNLSGRTYATLNISPKIDLEKQKELVNKFNKYFNDYREKYHSLFLSNYRESKDIARKRVSFDLIYMIVEYILENFELF